MKLIENLNKMEREFEQSYPVSYAIIGGALLIGMGAALTVLLVIMGA